jgi:hypothetical protein
MSASITFVALIDQFARKTHNPITLTDKFVMIRCPRLDIGDVLADYDIPVVLGQIIKNFHFKARQEFRRLCVL